MIKFRAWHHKHEVMYPVRAIDLALEYITVLEYDLFDFEDVELMQSTGLKDKNDVEIFDGDIVVNHVGDVWVITYFRGAFRYCPIESYSKEKEKQFETDNIGNFGTEAFEVIGNIYEDTEWRINYV